jgi:hypothetical protein
MIIITLTVASFSATGNIQWYFLIGTSFNVIRFFALGISIGYGYGTTSPKTGIIG